MPALLVIAVVALAGLAALIGAGALGGASPSPSTIASGSPGLIEPTPTPTPGSSATAPGTVDVRCDATEQFVYHVHSHLNIRVDGQLFLPPANVGIQSDCFYWLHTHAGSGVIHVEAPVEAPFNLGQFFDVWGEPLRPDEVGDHTVGPGQQLFVFIDGQRVENADPRAIVLGNLVSIELQIGVEPLDPLPYTFPPEFQ